LFGFHFLKFSAVKIAAGQMSKVLGSINDPKADVLGIDIVIHLSFYLEIEI